MKIHLRAMVINFVMIMVFSYQVSFASDNLVSTQLNDYLVNYHMTSYEQYAAGIKGGEGAQNSFAYSISIHNTDLHLIGTNTSGIYRSIDGGANWTHSSSGLGVGGISSIFFHPEKEGIVFASAFCGSTGYNTPPNGVGIYKSCDDGQTWQLVKSCIYYQRRGAMNFAYFKDKLYAISDKAIYVSDDDGNTWESISEGLGNNYTMSVSGDRLVIGGSYGIIYSTDGESFTSISNMAQKTVVSLAVDSADDEHMICITSGGELLESRDLGDAWTPVETVSGAPNGKSPVIVKFGAPDENGKSLLYVSFGNTVYNIRVSSNNGKSFDIPSLDLSYAPYNVTGYFSDAFCPHPTEPRTVMGAFNTVIFKSTDGGINYSYSSSGFSGFALKKIYFDDSGTPKYMGFIDRGISKMDSIGNSEEYPLFSMIENIPSYNSNTSVTDFDVDPENENKLIFITGSAGYNNHTIAGEIDVSTGEYKLFEDTADLDIDNIFFHSQNNQIIYAGWKVSYDRGVSWNDSEAYIYDCSKENGDIVWGFYPSKDGTLNRQMAISYNGGATWQPVGKYIYEPKMIVQDIADNECIWIPARGLYKYNYITGELVHFNENNGLLKHGSRALQVRCVAQDPSNPDHLLLSMRNSTTFELVDNLFETYDGGLNWYYVDCVQKNVGVDYLAFHPTQKKVYMGSAIGTLIYDYEKYYNFNVASNDYKEKLDISYNCDDGCIEISGYVPNTSVSVEIYNINTTQAELVQISGNILNGGIVYVNQFETDDGGLCVTIPFELNDDIYKIKLVRMDNGFSNSYILSRNYGITERVIYDNLYNKVSYVNSGENIKIVYNFENLSDKTLEVMEVIALYDGEELIKINIDEFIVEAKDSKEINSYFSVPNGNEEFSDLKIKTFLWDSARSMRPYYKTVQAQ